MSHDVVVSTVQWRIRYLSHWKAARNSSENSFGSSQAAK
jgi:hypothetical protein